MNKKTLSYCVILVNEEGGGFNLHFPVYVPIISPGSHGFHGMPGSAIEVLIWPSKMP